MAFVLTMHSCLLSTAGSPRVAPEIEEWQQLNSRVNSLSDTQVPVTSHDSTLNHCVCVQVLVNGGGLLGTEVACALKKKGHDVVLAFPEESKQQPWITLIPTS